MAQSFGQGWKIGVPPTPIIKAEHPACDKCSWAWDKWITGDDAQPWHIRCISAWCFQHKNMRTDVFGRELDFLKAPWDRDR